MIWHAVIAVREVDRYTVYELHKEGRLKITDSDALKSSHGF